MKNYLTEAFRKLEILDEETFSTDAKGLEELNDFINTDEQTDDVIVVDPEAETEEDVQDSYVGKVILDCCVCHSMSYKDKEEVVVDEEENLANVGEECPFCFSNDGFYVIGEVAPFNEEEVEEKDEEEVKVDDGEIEVEEKEEEKFESVKRNARKQRIKESVKRIQRKSVKESKETGEDLSEYQKWVDYDMKKYRKISDDTMKKIKSAGLSVVKDQYGDYEVIANRPVKEACKKSRRNKKSVNESAQDDYKELKRLWQSGEDIDDDDLFNLEQDLWLEAWEPLEEMSRYEDLFQETSGYGTQADYVATYCRGNKCFEVTWDANQDTEEVFKIVG